MMREMATSANLSQTVSLFLINEVSCEELWIPGLIKVGAAMVLDDLQRPEVEIADPSPTMRLVLLHNRYA